MKTKSPAGHLRLTAPPHVLPIPNARQPSVLCHSYSSKIRLHLRFLGRALVQHSSHFSVPDLIFSLPPNSIFQQIIPAAGRASPELRSFTAARRLCSDPGAAACLLPQQGATGNAAARPPAWPLSEGADTPGLPATERTQPQRQPCRWPLPPSGGGG